MWNSEIAVFQRYMGSGLMLLWFVMALVYLYYKEEKKINRILFLYVPTLILLLFFNPLFVRFFYEFAGDDIYFRICWLLPVTIVLAYFADLSVPSGEEAEALPGNCICADRGIRCTGIPEPLVQQGRKYLSCAPDSSGYL